MPPLGERVRQLGRDHAAAADRGVAHHPDLHGACFSSPGRTDRLAHDEAFREGHAGQGAELGVAALDQLSERGGRQPRGHRLVLGGRELAAVTGQRLPLALVVGRHVDDEGRRGAVVDEVVAQPVGPPRRVGRLVAPQAAGEHRRAEHVAAGDVIRMAIVPVRHGDRARARAPDQIDRRPNRRRRLGDRRHRASRGSPATRRRGRRRPRPLRPAAAAGVPLLDSSPAVRSHRPTRCPAATCSAMVPPRPISMSSGCGPKTSTSTGAIGVTWFHLARVPGRALRQAHCPDRAGLAR